MEPAVPDVTPPSISVEPTFFHAEPLYTLSLLSVASYSVRPAAGDDIAVFCAVVMRGPRKPFVVESIWSTAEASSERAPTPSVPAKYALPVVVAPPETVRPVVCPPAPTVEEACELNPFTSVRKPVESNVLVAEPPKYALSKTERRVVEAWVKEARPVSESVPDERAPIFAFVED